MHPRRLLPLVVAVGLAAAVMPAATYAAPALAAPTHTHQIIVRPVDTTGHLAPGFSVSHTYANQGVTCQGASASPGAVDDNIDYCSPSAAYAVACWKASVPHAIYCLQRFRSHQVVEYTGGVHFTKVSAQSGAQLTPLALVLGNGWVCSIRDGGAWGSLPHHPKLNGTYSCNGSTAVWAGFSAKRSGVNESKPVWTVRTGSFSGNGKLTTRKVKKAYFVGTYGSSAAG